MMLRRHLLLLSVTGFAPPTARAQHSNEVAERAPELEWVAGDLPPFAWRSPTGPRGYAGAPMIEAAMGEYGYTRQQFMTHQALGEATL